MTYCRRFDLPRRIVWLSNRRCCRTSVLMVTSSSYNASSSLSVADEMIRRRSFVSLLNTKDQLRPSVLRTNNPTTTTTTTTKTLSNNNDALLLTAAEEANRLLVHLAKHQKYYESKRNSTFSLSSSEAGVVASPTGHDEMVQQEVLEAANALLVVSNDLALRTTMNAAAVPSEQAQRHTAILHRTFLALTTKCLDCVRILQASSSSATLSTTTTTVTTTATTTDAAVPTTNGTTIVEEEEEEHWRAFLDAAMALARRAHELGLPFHLPLYQRLMEVTASTTTTSNATNSSSLLPERILEIASFTDTLAATATIATAAPVVVASLFGPALVALVRNHRWRDAVELLHGMRHRHDIAILDRSTATEMYVHLYGAWKVKIHTLAVESWPPRYESCGRDWPGAIPAAELVALLVPSVLDFADEMEKEARGNTETLNHMLDSMDEHEIERMMDTMFEAEDDDDDNFDSDDDNDDDYEDVVDRDNYGWSRETDPCHQAVHAILTSSVNDVQAKAVFTKLVSPGTTKPTIPRIISVKVAAKGSESDEVDLEYWADDSCSNSESEEEEEETDEDIGPHERRNHLQFPDVTAQVIHLNRGRDLMFTRRYEEIMWMKESESENRDRMERIYYSGTRLEDGNSDDSDDDDDDDY